ncbi:DUF6220 domain-containing protein [Heyndrickxia vini]|uniref:DoxX family protein n=1 Tax=Heyndrickxia vini TaxID=1476025 RepID=A0ABX7DYS3_9BACI|nr:DUF6220 domain-containing protein [Heyndrickxia vini]QQZ08628.1 hypothetical protein I5776_16540 [Heyndrickxia vini]
MTKDTPTNTNQIGRMIFLILSILFIMCLLTQVFFAGLAIFINPSNWANHTNFIHFFEWLPLLMLITSFVGKLPVGMRWQSAGLFVLIFLMYFTAHSNTIVPIKYSAAAHPVIAMVLFILSVNVTQRAAQMLRHK